MFNLESSRGPNRGVQWAHGPHILDAYDLPYSEPCSTEYMTQIFTWGSVLVHTQYASIK